MGQFRGVPVPKTVLEAAPKPFSALFGNRNSLFRNILAISPLNPKILREFLPNSMIPLRSERGGGS
jgi:hypothetical protein